MKKIISKYINKLLEHKLEPIIIKVELLIKNIQNNNQTLEQHGLNLDNNNKMLDMTKKNLDNINFLIEKVPEVLDKIEYLDGKIDMLATKLGKIQKRENTSVEIINKEKNVDNIIIDKSENKYIDIDYFDFENYFRGSRKHIKKVQEIYLPYFKDCSNVVDIGCGRGEFLELLKDNNINAIGVDYYDEFVEYCRMKELNVVCGDAVEYLEKVEKVDGIYAGQLIEHLETEQVIRLCELAYKKLLKGCYAIFETPNPTSLAIFANSFYMDPSHIKPVHPLTLKYFMEKAGFKDINIIYTESSKIDITIPKIKLAEHEEEFNHTMEIVQNTLFGSQDYAIIVRR